MTLITNIQFKFIVEEDVALPVDAIFWDYLMRSSQIQWSLIVYEQDWLDVQYPKTRALQVRQLKVISKRHSSFYFIYFFFFDRLLLTLERYG